MTRMRLLFKGMFPVFGLAILLALTLALAPAIADTASGDEVLEKAAAAVEAGVSAGFFLLVAVSRNSYSLA